MKLRSLFLAMAGALILTGGIVPKANAVLVTYFNFNDAILNGAPDLTSDAPGVQSSTLVVAGETNTAVTGINLNIAAGDPEPFGLGIGFSDNEELSNATMTFQVNTLGLSMLSLSFAITGNSGGYDIATGSFSTNGGVTFSTVGVSGPVALPNNGTNQLVTFTYPATVNNLGSVLFRVTLSGADETENVTNPRTTVDNIQLNAVPEPATVMGGLLGVCGLCWHQRRRLIGLLRLRLA